MVSRRRERNGVVIVKYLSDNIDRNRRVIKGAVKEICDYSFKEAERELQLYHPTQTILEVHELCAEKIGERVVARLEMYAESEADFAPGGSRLAACERILNKLASRFLGVQSKFEWKPFSNDAL